jgi:hypothetical protein
MSVDPSSPRFARQRILAGFGAEAQQKLAGAHVLVIGAGGLGSAVLPLLAAAGVGILTVVDDDTVAESNLHRQTLHTAGDVGANLPRYDAVDARTVKDVLARKTSFKGSKTGMPGIIDSQADVGGWPELKSTPAPADGDHDGMPDAWETAHHLDPADASDGAKVGDDGYSNLEHYLNELAGAKED